MTPEEELVEFIVETEFQDIPEDVVSLTKYLAMKNAAGFLAGTNQPLGRRILSYVTERDTEAEEAGVIGCGFRSSVENAIFANATFGHASELENNKITTGRGVSWDLTTFPITFSMADKYRLSGKEFITASAISLEVQARLAIPPERGPNYNSLLQSGTTAAAVAATKSMRLKAAETQNALGMAWGGGFLFMPNTGTDAHFLDSSFQNVRGFQAAELANDGMTGNPKIQELLEAMCGDDAVPAKEVIANLGSEWQLKEIGIKKYPCCFHLHRHIDVMKELVDQHDISSDQVELVEVHTGPVEADMCGRPDPSTTEDAKFSYQHALAAVLLEGDVNYQQLEPHTLTDSDYDSLRSKVEVHSEEGLDPVRFVTPARVAVHLSNGETVEREQEHLMGGPGHRLGSDEYRDLYRKFTEGILPDEAIHETADAFLSLEDKQNLDQLIHRITYRE